MALTKAQLVDLNANELIIDLDADTSITADTDDQIDIKIAGADDFRFTANTFTALSGSTIAAQALTATTITTTGAIAIANDGNIGSAGDADAIAISSSGVVTFSQSPVFPDGSLAVVDLDIDGATDIGADLTTSDLIVVDDGAGGTNRKAALSRINTLVQTAGGFPLTALDVDGGTDIGAGLADADLFIVDDGAGGTNRKTAASRIKTYIADVTLTTAASGTVSIEYTYADVNLYLVPSTDANSIKKYGRKSKQISAMGLQGSSNLSLLQTNYMNDQKEANQRITIEVPKLLNSIRINHEIQVKNDITGLNITTGQSNPSVQIKSIEWFFPEGKTVINAGEHKFDSFDIDKFTAAQVRQVSEDINVTKTV